MHLTLKAYEKFQISKDYQGVLKSLQMDVKMKILLRVIHGNFLDENFRLSSL